MGRSCRASPLQTRVLRLLLAVAPCVSGSNYVLKKFQDARCTQMHPGVGSQQSWMRIGGSHSSCYHVMAGFACQFQCFMRMRCEYGSGSGVVIEDMPDNTCMGQVRGTRNLATHWTWLQAKSLFDGGCVQLDASTWLMFDIPLGTRGYPNCESEGAVAKAGEDSPNAFQGSYTLQFYMNNLCTDEYTPTSTSTQTASRFLWRVHRGARYCYDYVDETPRTSDTANSRLVPQSIYNFHLFCGNADMSGNGIRVRKYDGAVCSGRAAAPEDWRGVFHPMNFPTVSKLFQGECVRWSTYYVKFDKAWEQSHYPECSQHACAKGYCAGGRITSSVWSSYSGPIKTLPSTTSGAGRGRSPQLLGHPTAAAAAAWLLALLPATQLLA